MIYGYSLFYHFDAFLKIGSSMVNYFIHTYFFFDKDVTKLNFNHLKKLKNFLAHYLFVY